MNGGSEIQFKKLFEPGRIGQMQLKNRIIMAPTGTNFANQDGTVSSRILQYYGARARGGVSLVIVEPACVESKLGQTYRLPCELRVDDEKFVSGLSELAKTIQSHGAKAAIQIHHAGPEGLPKDPHLQAVAPSAVPSALELETSRLPIPRELTIAEIQELVNLFAVGAGRIKRAGFDGIELHGAHGYIIARFLSGYSNRRTDKYGGNVNNRARFLLEIIGAVREKVGKDYPLWCRLNGREFGMEGGMTTEEGRQVALLAQNAGCDAIHISGFGTGGAKRIPPMGLPAGYFSWMAEGIKKVVNVPVIIVGRITPELGEGLLREGKADFISMARPLIADPDLPQKVASGALRDIRPCLCCDDCMASLDGFHSPDKSMRCAVNATVGREIELAINLAKKARKVVIIGGGPAGLEAARVAALRGHQVILIEKENIIGGQLHAASIPPYKQSIQKFRDYLVRQVEKLGVEIQLGKRADVAQIEQIKPDVIVLAAGSTPTVPEIPGITRQNVFIAQDILTDNLPIGESVVVIGGELVGCETAEFLAEQGKKVTITRRSPEMAVKMPPDIRRLLLDRLTMKGVTCLTGVKYENITDEGLQITTKDGERQTIKADTIVLAVGASPNAELFNSLKAKGYKVHTIGDCTEPRWIMDAMYEGYMVSRSI